jgi:hypothetical protein
MMVLKFAMRVLAGVALGFVVLWVSMPRIARSLGVGLDDGMPATHRQATAVLDRTTWHFSLPQAGSIVEATFRVRNTGDERLILRRSNGSCDCIATVEPEIIVNPGCQRTVSAKLDSSRFPPEGRIELDYQSNDPQQPLIRLFWEADLVAGH